MDGLPEMPDGVHRSKKKIKNAETEDAPGRDDSDCSIDPARLRIMAVKLLGYTQTEYGLRPLHKIFEELNAHAELYRAPRESGDDGSWMDEEVD